MTTLFSLITEALDNGLNPKLLLQATGLDKSTFDLKLHDNEFRDEERKVIKQVIREWERMEDLG